MRLHWAHCSNIWVHAGSFLLAFLHINVCYSRRTMPMFATSNLSCRQIASLPKARRWRSLPASTFEACSAQASCNPRGCIFGSEMPSTRATRVFKQLDDIPRWIFKEDLPARSRFGDFTAECCSRAAQLVDHTVEIFRNDHESAPPARLGISSCLASATGARGVDKEVQVLKR